jgi:DNA polymerase-2
MDREAHGFILQPTYRIEAGKPVVHLFGTLDGGQSFLVRQSGYVPHFWIRESDADRARGFGAGPLTATGKVTMDREPVVEVDVPTPPDTPELRNRLQNVGIPCFEADVRFAMRYLIDQGIRGSMRISGRSHKGKRVDRVFENPRLTPASFQPELSVLSFDIETDPKAQHLLSIALHGCGVSEVLLFSPADLPTPNGAIGASTEAELLKLFCQRVLELDPDVMTGWNIVEFDFPVLLRRAEALDVPFEIGRVPGATRQQRNRYGRQNAQISVPGRCVLDGISLLRGSFVKMERLSLEFVAQEVLGRGKLVTGRNRAEEIVRMFREDRERLVEYNLSDARLVTEILDELDLMELTVQRSLLTGMPPDRVASSIAAFEFRYLTELARRDIVAPSVIPNQEVEGMGGGHVLEPISGLFDNVLVLDFRSLYPSLIRTFHIDPLGYVAEPSPEEDLIRAPNGAHFRRQPGILTQLLDELFPMREQAQRDGNGIASFAIKILMNSFFGVLGTPACRFYNPEIANAITSFGRELLLWCKRRIELDGLRVLYGDTDSLFIDTGASDADEAQAVGVRLLETLNRDLAEHIHSIWQVESRLELEFDKLYLRLFLPHVRHGTRGARKRYAGLVRRDGEERVVFTGLEVVRTDWTDLARETQQGLYERLFRDQPVEEFLRGRVAALRDGRLDAQLVYRKVLRKRLDEYTSTTPPHVAAARKMSERPGRRISYVMTIGGPEPAEERQNPFDYEHYVAKQVRPIAEPVLEHLGLDFDKVVGDDAQLELF